MASDKQDAKHEDEKLPSGIQNNSSSSSSFSELQDAEQKNAKLILCQFCDEKILLPNTARMCQKELQLHKLNAPASNQEKESLNEHWIVTNRYHFENVGVSRPTDPSDQFRYLTCATCDRGPIGITFTAEREVYYVAHSRVKYA